MYSFDVICNKGRMLWSMYLKDKHEATLVKVIGAYRRHIKSHYGASLKHMWSDNEPALLSEGAIAFLDDKAILFQNTPPHQRYKNDKVERIHNPFGRLTTICLHAGHLPKNMWTVAHAHAVRILNITPCGTREFCLLSSTQTAA